VTALRYAALVWLAVAGQPAAPREQIAADMPADVREQVLRLYDRSAQERGEACEALGRMGEKAAPAVPRLVALLGDDAIWFAVPRSFRGHDLGRPTYQAVWRQAWGALVRIGRPLADAGPVLAALSRKNRDVRAAASALGAMKDRRAVEALLDALGDDAPLVRGAAAEALGKIGDARAAPALAALLGDRYPGPAERAAEALARLGRPAADALVTVLESGTPRARASAAATLARITGQDFGQDAARWRAWLRTNETPERKEPP
jgi:HEAT repeat protein